MNGPGFLRGMSLKSKLILLYCLTITVPFLLIGQVILQVYGNLVVRQTTELSQESVKQVQLNLKELLDRHTDILDRFAFDSYLRSYLNPKRSYADNRDSIDAYNNYLKPITNNLAFTDGQVSLSIYFLNETLLPGLGIYAYADERIRSGKAYSNAVEAGTGLAWGLENGELYLSRSIREYTGKIYGVAVVRLPEKLLYALMKESDPENNRILIADDRGRVVSSNDRDRVGTSISEEPFYVQTSGLRQGAAEVKDGQTYKVLFETFESDINLIDWKVYSLIPIDHLLKEEKRVRTIGIAAMVVMAVLSCVLFVFFLDRITNGIQVLVGKMKSLRNGEFSTIEDKGHRDEIGIMTRSFNRMVEGLERMIQENYLSQVKINDINIKKREAELYALQSQIHPHFLFNTLDSIRMKLLQLPTDDHQEASDMVLNLSKILRKSLNWQSGVVTLADELDLVTSYLEIQRSRFKDKIDYRIEIPSEWSNLRIPKLILQPIVENAIQHGLEKKRGQGMIRIRGTGTSAELTIEIIDDGIGMDRDKAIKIQGALNRQETLENETSIGIKNVHDRIRLHFGEAYGVTIDSVPGEGTIVALRMPREQSVQLERGNSDVENPDRG